MVNITTRLRKQFETHYSRTFNDAQIVAEARRLMWEFHNGDLDTVDEDFIGRVMLEDLYLALGAV